ncbi:DNA-binding SARP family transcriptional activator/tetratricopeptide (TPR) repeat protein [Streptosporangium becharense]|uniref:DNA-binding SARP family transcriptional activator n=1 Tax=Streptosporangium becharense TaxID=1816182 RepID=A0A7W9MHF9_9ACTN|nr:AfsR/SARP family transcriptional regulator [Streptosporangium becharense]MBB2912645.1 DNA-binding SARP family transcriptional activator/tetratricopeptide (TPR) repeat protein [Streptosporangium becharense]MBB5820526.1 DNA-binding SARP family transcriptional activator [Streptosporangium becharense]
MAVQGSEDGLRFAVLGPVQAWRDGIELDLGTPLQRSILTMLLLREGRAVTPAEMIDSIWGDDAPPRALGALRTYVSRLRAVLEPDRSPRARPQLLTSVGRGYALRLDGDALDLVRFERGVRESEAARREGDPARAAESLRASLRLWRGDPLAGAVGPYTEHQRGRLAERRMSVVEVLMDLDLELGRHADVLSELIALSAEHPLRERLRAQLMLAYYRCGRKAEALAAFADTRATLVEELGIEPGPDLTSLHRRILTGDPSLTPAALPARSVPARAPVPVRAATGRATGPGTAGGAGVRATAEGTGTSAASGGTTPPELPRPAQLPAAVNDFTGRRRIVTRLRTLLSGGDGTEGVPVAAISGIGGVGKTALAVHVAHAMQDSFPDGQLYADLRGYGAEPAAPESVLAAFLRGLGLPADAVPDGLAERSALFRSLLADRRMLVLLDNARDAAQVGHLLPGSTGCAAVVTSRGKLADLAAARLFDLDVMEPDEALALFGTVAGNERVSAERPAAMDAVAACGFLPLAVRIVAARLAARPSWTVASLVLRLADERRRLDELRVGDLAVEATFALGYGQLGPAQARAFRLLSLPDGPDISVEAAAALLALDPVETEDVLESLVDASLLEAPAPGRYRFHDLLRLFARRTAERAENTAAAGGEGAAASRRLLDFYLASARSAHRLAYEGSTIADRIETTATGRAFTSADEAMAWLSVEAESLFASVFRATSAGDPGWLLPGADLLLAMEPLLESGSHVREFESRTREMLAAARRLGSVSGELRCRYVLGRVLFGANRLAEAEDEFRTALELSSLGDRVVAGELLNALAVVSGRRRRHAEALAWFEAAREAFRETGAQGGEALTLSYSARDHLFLGQAEEAIAAAEQGLALFIEMGSSAGTARARYHLGMILSRVGRLNEAVHHHAECLAFFRAGNQRVWEQRVCSRLAETFIHAGRFPDATRHAEEALAVSREIGHPYGEAQALAVLGRALAGLGSAGRSRVCLERAHGIFRALGAPEADDLRALLDRDQTGD